jgi:hypothetical protein
VRQLLGLVLLAGTLGAQTRPEVRMEAVHTGSGYHAEAGLGIATTLGSYLRAGALVALNSSSSPSRVRAEGQVRFLLDPLDASRWGLSFAGGLGVQKRGYLLFGADLEGPRMGRVRPAVQLTLGGGTRLGVILRGARPNLR